MGAVPISFELEAATLNAAIAKFGEAAEQAVQQTMRELQEMRREQASSLVIPDAAGAGLPNPSDLLGRGRRRAARRMQAAPPTIPAHPSARRRPRVPRSSAARRCSARAPGSGSRLEQRGSAMARLQLRLLGFEALDRLGHARRVRAARCRTGAAASLRRAPPWQTRRYACCGRLRCARLGARRAISALAQPVAVAADVFVDAAGAFEHQACWSRHCRETRGRGSPAAAYPR